MFGSKGPKNDPKSEGSGESLEILEHLQGGDIDAGRFFPRSAREAIRPQQAPQPPGAAKIRRNPLVLIINGLISLVVFGFIIAAAAFFIGKQEFEAPGPLHQTRTVIVPQGEGLRLIARRLEREGIISDALLFLAGVYATKSADQLKAGEYLFQEQVSMRQVMDLLVEGKAILHKVTIPEGLTSEQVVARLRENEILTGDIGDTPPEGALLPDTYKFMRGTERSAILARMRKAHERALERIWQRRDKNLPLKTKQELVILASIVEKETGRADERPRVASVFVNRLRKSIRLQSDPTIIYGIAGGKGLLGRPILRSEINTPTPYNTYQIDGLPPTPIANPGIEALEATANPSHTGDLYFVADGSGGHVFAATLADHNRNVARWRKIQAEAEAAQASAEEAAAAPAAGKDKVPPTPKLRIDLSTPPSTAKTVKRP